MKTQATHTESESYTEKVTFETLLMEQANLKKEIRWATRDFGLRLVFAVNKKEERIIFNALTKDSLYSSWHGYIGVSTREDQFVMMVHGCTDNPAYADMLESHLENALNADQEHRVLVIVLGSSK